MPRLVVIAALALLSGCIQEGAPKIPPPDRLYFPAAIHHQDGVGAGGRLYVASANTDGRYDFGTVTAINVDDLALPPFGGDPACLDWTPRPPGTPEDPASPCVPKVVRPLGTAGVAGAQVLTDNFASGRFGTLSLPSGALRLFLPTRDERDRVHVIDADPASARRLDCFGVGEDADDCTVGSPSMTYKELEGLGHPRAIQVVNVAVNQASGAAYVVHRTPASETLGQVGNFQSYVAQLDGFNPTQETIQYHPLGGHPANGIALGERYAYLVGFSISERPPPLLRLLDLTDPTRVINAGLEAEVTTLDGRDVAVSSDGLRLYVLSRFPDLLLVMEITGPSSDSPRVAVVRQVPLPDDPNQLRVISRGPGRGDLVVITCSQADAVVVYDEDVGNLVGQFPDFGRQPFGISADLQGTGARLYITNWADGQVGVLDMPNLDQPEELRKVAVVGAPQACLMESTGKGCEQDGVAP